MSDPKHNGGVSLPAALRQRWQPIRGGLLNIYRYDYQEFRYEGGRLLLRGNNGTGKSRVLALQLPFLLDGEITPQRVEPDQDSAKRMEWNLLLGGKHDDRLGYTWIEFGRVTENGEAEYKTLGCALRAVQGYGIRQQWFFITSQRIGRDLFLENAVGQPLSKTKLEAALGDQGKVFGSGKVEDDRRDYRNSVNQALFGLGDRYEALLNLLIQLRQPQLSRTLNEERLLGRVVAAVREVVDEIVVVDCGSTDATVAIAEAAGARVINQEWLGNGRQKRFAEDHCRHDFLLDLDADEVLSPALAAEIRALFSAGAPPLPVYELRLVTVPPVGKPWTNIAVAYRRKLYDRRVVRAPDHKAWDQFEVPAGVKVGRLTGDLLHYSFRDLAHLVEKLNRVSSVRARDGKQAGRAAVAARVLFAWPFYFLKHFVLRGHYRSGLYGIVLASIAANGRWQRDAKMYERILADREQARERE